MMIKRKIRIGTRGSRLALKQVEQVIENLKAKYPYIETEVVKIKTSGDKFRDAPLANIGGKGLFLKEIEEVLLKKDIDVAVHSLKDVPAEIPKELEIIATLKREDPRDAFISYKYNSLNELVDGSVVGTCSLRRKSQLLRFNKNLKIKDLRGNVNTRLNKLRKGEYDAIVIAAAGLIRLNLSNEITEVLDTNIMIPAIGQGVIALETRKDDIDTKNLLGVLNDSESNIAAKAERAFLKVVEGGCQVPLGCFCNIVDSKKIVLNAFISSIDGKDYVLGYKEANIEKAEEAGKELAHELLNKGGSRILEGIL
ncbi:MAG: hydroxymethylbilane synthase [Deferribacterota bacterium]|nr:hydroxymethylbilane synthase [Deferribacterota bacterium]